MANRRHTIWRKTSCAPASWLNTVSSCIGNRIAQSVVDPSWLEGCEAAIVWRDSGCVAAWDEREGAFCRSRLGSHAGMASGVQVVSHLVRDMALEIRRQTHTRKSNGHRKAVQGRSPTFEAWKNRCIGRHRPFLMCEEDVEVCWCGVAFVLSSKRPEPRHCPQDQPTRSRCACQ